MKLSEDVMKAIDEALGSHVVRDPARTVSPANRP